MHALTTGPASGKQMEAPRIDPVGVLEQPAGWRGTPRSHSPSARIFALLVLLAFGSVGIATTVQSLASWCLTSGASSPPPR